MTMGKFKAQLGPLHFPRVDQPIHGEPGPPSADEFLQFLCLPDTASDFDSLLARYREIAAVQPQLAIVPAEQRILDKLVWPLRHAKGSYMLGNYLGTIALCGLVAEMVANLLFELSPPKMSSSLTESPRSITIEEQKALYSAPFEKLGQHRRIEILSAHRTIDPETKQHFDVVKNTRKRYLHLWSQDHERLPRDASAAFAAATHLVIRALGQSFQDGKVVVQTKLLEYLERQGTFEPEIAGDA